MRGEFGALASKSALSAAARGRQLPSWDTTWEFVRVLAVDILGECPDTARSQWRARWERARAGVAESSAPSTSVAEPAQARPRRRWQWLAVVAVAAATALSVGAVMLIQDVGADVPAEQAAPPPALIDGDRSEWVGDVTIPDGTEVLTGSHFVKTWEIRNAGTVPWVDRHLRRDGSFGNPAECETVQQVAIPDTRPGESVRISVDVRAPDSPGYCQVYWKMVDDRGRLMLPGARALFFLVKVVD